VAQRVSYELCLRFFLLCVIFFFKRLNLRYFLRVKGPPGAAILFPLLLLVFSVLLAESNRRPFDFSESPSELVRGFMTEYRGVGFVILFIREYIIIMFMGLLYIVFFFFFPLSTVALIISLICYSYI